jgi:hypothetical protein
MTNQELAALFEQAAALAEQFREAGLNQQAIAIIVLLAEVKAELQRLNERMPAS